MPLLIDIYKDVPEKIQPIVRAWKGCKDCGLCETRTNIVFFRGEAPCDVLFIGEAPGSNEDLSGLPFVGRSGSLLDSLLDLCKEDGGLHYRFGITNIVSCIPYEGDSRKVRPPTAKEADACKLRLLTTIEAASPLN